MEELAWRDIINDVEAELALRDIQEKAAELQRMKNICDTFISEYQFKKQQAQEKFDKYFEYEKARLASYFQGVYKKVTKTQATYDLPSGKLKLKYGTPEFVRDEEKLLSWLKESGKNELIKIKESPDWATLKKEVSISGENVVDADGQVIDGVTVLQREDKFEIEF